MEAQQVFAKCLLNEYVKRYFFVNKVSHFGVMYNLPESLR